MNGGLRRPVGAMVEGDPRSRDSAYHQGTVWAWLMGPFLTAYIKVNGRSQKARDQATQWLAAFGEHLSDAGLGQISEIFDADPPHRPRGCIAQAWSVAELLRATMEDVLGPQPAPAKPKAGKDAEPKRPRGTSGPST